MRLFLRSLLGIIIITTSAVAQTAWVQLSGTTFTSSMCPADGASGSICQNGTQPYPYRSSGCTGTFGGANTNCTGILSTWTGGIARTKSGSEEMWLLDGGGHADYGGNESYMLNLHVVTPTFTRIGNPSTLLSSYFLASTRSYPDGKPSSRHTYDGTTYVPWLDKFFLWSGAAYGLGTPYFDGWFYDPNIDPAVSNPWTEVVPSSAGGCINPTTAGFLTAHEQWVIANSNDHMLYMSYYPGWFFKLDPTTSCYTNLGQVGPNSIGGLKSIFDPGRNRAVLVGGGKVYTMPFSSSGAVDVTSSVGATCTTLYNSYGPGGFYDATNDRYVLYPETGGNTLYTLNPTTWACNTITTTGGPSYAGLTQGLWGKFNYFPTLGKIAVMGPGSAGWYTFDYASVTPVAPTITTTTLPNGTKGSAYSQTLAATGVPSGFTWSLFSGSLPTGLSLNTSTGVISGTPTVAMTSSFTVKVTNGVAPDASQALTILVTGGTNTFTVTNTGSTSSNYPVQIGRAFVQGEIPSGTSPQAVISGATISTQVDSKNVWGDGSLKYAIVSFLIPTFTSSTTYTVEMVRGSTVGNTALTQAQMQAGGFNFDAVISLTNGGTTRTASARTMLNNNDYTVWASGPIATTIILAHHAQGFACPSGTASGAGSVASKYDFGVDTHCAFRPIFQATFWAGTNQVFVRYIGEIANTEQYEDVSITSMSLTIGNSSPTTWYTHGTSLTMNAGTRWTKTQWLGGTPPAGAINHNLSYLESSFALPNYDTTRTVSGATITSLYSNWTGSTKDIYQKGIWDSTLGAGGGHTHVAPYPQWTVQYLYTGDVRMQEIAIGQAELLSSVEWHFREGKSGKKLDRAGAINGVGFPLSISNRTTINTYDLTLGSSGDKVVPIGAQTLNNNWGSGSANSFGYWGDPISHPPEIWSPTYLLTGDHFFLEEGQFQAAFMAAVLGAPNTGDWRSRGPTGAEGGIIDRAQQRFQTRGQSWAVRSRAEMAWISPDADSFKAYLTTLLDDNLAMWEGQRGITGSPYQGNTMWNFGQTQATANVGSTGTQWDLYEDPTGGHKTTPSPLHFWDNGNAASCDTSNTIQIVDIAVTDDCASPWFDDYMLYALGRAAELGYSAVPLRDWIGANKIGMLTDAGYNPWLAGAYRNVVTSTAGGNPYFTTWAAAKAGYLVTSSGGAVQAETDFYPGTIFSGCQGDPTANCQPLLPAVSMVSTLTNGAAAWNFVNTNIMPSIANNPMWAIKPRAALACSVSPSSVGPYTASQVVSVSFTASNCTSSTYTATGLSGSGLSLNSSTGALTGTAVAGSYSVTVSYDTASNPFTLTINAAPSITTSSPLPAGTVGSAYSQTLAASGGTSPLSWSVSSGTVPTGTSLSSSGVLSGTPSSAVGSPFTFTALVTDANSITNSKSFTVTINSVITSGGSLIRGKIVVGGKTVIR